MGFLSFFIKKYTTKTPTIIIGLTKFAIILKNTIYPFESKFSYAQTVTFVEVSKNSSSK